MKAFENKNFDYYELTQPVGFNGRTYLIPDGAIFVHDTTDNIRGASNGQGCLKLCFTPDGGTYGCLYADTVIFHTMFITTDLFKKVDISKINALEKLICTLESQLVKAKNELKNLKGVK